MSAALMRRAGASALVTGACLGYLVWKVDLGEAWSVLSEARLAPFLGAVAIVIAVTVPLAWRWQLLLRARGVDEGLTWLVRASFAAQAVGQVVPTGIGGDAMRIFETSRRHPGRRRVATGSVLLERVLGGCATLALAGVAFALAVGETSVSGYTGVELGAAAIALVGCITLFSRRARKPLALLVPPLRRLRLERPARHAYEAVHAYRGRPRLLLGAFALTLAVQAVRVLAIWLCGRAAGVELSPRPFYVMGPLLFLVALIPFTVNGLAVRESLFVAFLGGLGVPANEALVTGLLYFLLSIALAVPGALILAVEAGRRPARTAGAQALPPLPLNAWLRYDGIVRALRRAGNVASVLEVGPGTGSIGARLASSYRYVAVEPDEQACEVARSRLLPRGGTVLRGDVSAVSPGEVFDLVCAFEVLEHIEDDASALRAWRDRLGDQGWILLSVPAHQRRFGPHDTLVGHYRRYDPHALSELLVANGFERPVVLMCGFPFGYLLELARNTIGRFARPADTFAERTAASGRWLQPSGALGPLTRAVSFPFRLIQRPFARTSLGTGLVVLARRA